MKTIEVIIRVDFDDTIYFCEQTDDKYFECWSVEYGFEEKSINDLEEMQDAIRSMYHEAMQEYKDETGVDKVKVLRLSTIKRRMRGL